MAKDVSLDEIFKHGDEGAGERPPKKPSKPAGDDSHISDADLENDLKAMSPRGQKRIKELLESNKELSESLRGKDTEIETLKKGGKDRKESGSNAEPNDTDLESLIDSIEDENSRALLKEYGGRLKKAVLKDLTPTLSKVDMIEFKESLATLIDQNPGMSKFEDRILELKKSNPQASLKSIVGELVVDIGLQRRKPIDSGSPADRRERSLDEFDSKDELYDLLESMRPNS